MSQPCRTLCLTTNDHVMRSSLLLLLAFLSLPTGLLRAQAVEEPPIPVMIVCPYHSDSLRKAYEAGYTNRLDDGHQAIDSVGMNSIRAAEALSEQMERSFLYLYVLSGVLALISIAALRVAYRLRNELQEVRDAQRSHQLALPSPVVVESVPLERPSSKPHPKRASRTSRANAKKTTRTRRPQP